MKRAVHCWHLEDDGTTCDTELVVKEGEYACPLGHRLRQWTDLSQWARDHIEVMQPAPAMHRRFFGDIG